MAGAQGAGPLDRLLTGIAAIYPDFCKTQDANGYRTFEASFSGTSQLVRGSAVQVPTTTILESAYGGDGNVYSSSFSDVNAFVELEIVTELFESGALPYGGGLAPHRLVYMATLQKFFYSQAWTIGVDLSEITAQRGGAAFTADTLGLTVGLNMSGTNNGNLSASITFPAATGYTFNAPSCAWKLRIFGGGRYA